MLAKSLLRRAGPPLAAVVSCAMGVTTVSRAHAQEGSSPRVYVVTVASSPRSEWEATRADGAARDAVRAITGIRSRRADARYTAYPAAALARLRRARQKLAAGRQAYQNVELDRAIELLSDAVESFDASAAVLDSPDELGEALLFLGAAQVFANKMRDAQRTFERVHVQLPSVRPDEQVFNPDVVQRFAAAAPRGPRDARIMVRSDPPNGLVFVDFQPRGRAPVNVDGLAPGTHVVRVVRAGAAPFVQRVEVRRGATASLDAEVPDGDDAEGLGEAMQGLARAQDAARATREAPVLTVARTLELDKIGVLRVSYERGDTVDLELSAYDVASGIRVAHQRQTVATGALPDAVARLVTGGVQAALTAPVVQRGAVEEEEEEEEEHATGGPPTTQPYDDRSAPTLLERWWFWVGVAVVVAGGATAIYFATQSGGDDGNEGDGQIVLEF